MIFYDKLHTSCKISKSVFITYIVTIQTNKKKFVKLESRSDHVFWVTFLWVILFSYILWHCEISLCSQNTRLLILYVHMYFPYWWFLRQFEFCVTRELLFWKVRSVPNLQYFTWEIPVFLTSWSPSQCGLYLETCLSWCCFSLVVLHGFSKLQQFLDVFDCGQSNTSPMSAPSLPSGDIEVKCAELSCVSAVTLS